MKRFEYLIKDYLKQTKLLQGVKFGILLEEWENILGHFLAEKIKPITFKQGTLECLVSHSVLMQEQLYLKTEILKCLQQHEVGRSIKSLKFTVAEPLKISLEEWQRIEDMNAQRQHYLKTLKGSTPVKEPSNFSQATASIHDPDTRHRVQRLFQAIQKRQAELDAQNWRICFECQTYLSPDYPSCPYCGKPVNLK